MSYKIIYSKEALQDIRSIYYYISFHLKEQRTAEKIVRNIRDEKTVNIIRILYGGQNIEKQFE